MENAVTLSQCPGSRAGCARCCGAPPAKRWKPPPSFPCLYTSKEEIKHLNPIGTEQKMGSAFLRASSEGQAWRQQVRSWRSPGGCPSPAPSIPSQTGAGSVKSKLCQRLVTPRALHRASATRGIVKGIHRGYTAHVSELQPQTKK